MNFLVLINTQIDQHLEEIHKLIDSYDHSIRINKSTWLINTKYHSKVVKKHLANILSINDSILIFEVSKDCAISNNLGVEDWLEDVENDKLDPVLE